MVIVRFCFFFCLSYFLIVFIFIVFSLVTMKKPVLFTARFALSRIAAAIFTTASLMEEVKAVTTRDEFVGESQYPFGMLD